MQMSARFALCALCQKKSRHLIQLGLKTWMEKHQGGPPAKIIPSLILAGQM